MNETTAPAARPDRPAEHEVIEREVRIAARPETVFSYFVDPAKLPLWMGRRATLDPRSGGVFELEYAEATAQGTYLEVVPYTRVVFTWGWAGPDVLVPPGGSVVEVTLTPDGPDTILHLRHRGLPPAERAGHGEGWDQFLPLLVAAAEGSGIRDQGSGDRKL